MSPAEFDTCDSTSVHYELVDAVRGRMPEAEPISDVAELFRAFGEPTRTRIVCALSLSEMCVCDLAALLGMTSSAVSHQLRVLRQTRLITSRRDGKSVYYSLADDHIQQLFQVAFQHIMEE